ncbi:MAG: YdeI/OmpD-associated family protein [Anaerolineae bacterium]|jgi:uncharacterized protein YdeI (YjbR/CyaY-like superfamily)|nr:YdeI/OmpD-associated family protein [Anaerolineae bacterium]
MKQTPELPTIQFESAQAWEAWLAENHDAAPGLWLKLAKKNSGIDSVSYREAVDVALCYGWIDSQARSFDEDFYLQRFTPRKARSPWSRINRERATALMEQGRIRPAGLREIERAREDGRWDRAYEPQSAAGVPEDLQQALDQNPRAKEFFEGLTASQRYSFLYRIQDAKRPETRARRIAQYVAMLDEGKTLR